MTLNIVCRSRIESGPFVRSSDRELLANRAGMRNASRLAVPVYSINFESDVAARGGNLTNSQLFLG